MASFFKKANPKEKARENERGMRRNQRDLEKDRRDLDVQEKQIEVEIKKMARQGNREACVTLAKQIVNIRKQRTRSYNLSAKVAGINTQSKAMMSNAKIADAIKTTTKTMGDVNKKMDPLKVAQTMREFEKANTKMDMSEEMMNEALDDILNESGDEEEQDAVVNQVLDEIGIEFSGKLVDAPSAHKGQLGAKSSTTASASKKLTDADIDKLLQNLKS